MDNMLPSTKELLSSSPCVPDYASMLSKMGRNLDHEHLRTIAEQEMHIQRAGGKLIPMATGIPMSKVFPVVSADIHLRDGSTLQIDEKQMGSAVNYGNMDGYPPLREWFTELQRLEHNPPQLSTPEHPEPFSLSITSGAFDGSRHAVHCLIDEDDSVLMERETYCSFTSVVRLYGSDVPVDHDGQGMLVKDLEDILSTWDSKHPGRPRPRVMYAITAGNNPTGYNWTEQRMVDVYYLCRKYDILILEDAAYYYLQFGEARNRSFQSIDIDGRVIRFDTLSKIIGAGYRIGWTSGPSTIIKKIAMDIQYTYLHTNMFSQVVILNLLTHWGHEKFIKNMDSLADVYRRKAKLTEGVLRKHLTGLCTWNFPDGGLFFWLTVQGMDVTDEFMHELLHKRGLSLIAGHYFLLQPGKSSTIRMSFSLVPEEDVEAGIQCLAQAIREFKDGKSSEVEH